MLDDLSIPTAARQHSLESLNALGSVLSAWEEAIPLRHLMTMLFLGANLPEKGSKTDDDQTHDCRVGFPIMRLGIPSTCWRPHMLGITVEVNCQMHRAWYRSVVHGDKSYGILGPPPIFHSLEQTSKAPVHYGTSLF